MRGKKVISICKHCQKEFEALLAKKNQGKALFCSADCYREYRKNNAKFRDKKLMDRLYQKKSKYNLSEKEYLELFEKQNNLCAICGKDLMLNKACVDHCHGTGLVRGILCDSCNRGLGFFQDNVENLSNAIFYLKN